MVALTCSYILKGSVSILLLSYDGVDARMSPCAVLTMLATVVEPSMQHEVRRASGLRSASISESTLDSSADRSFLWS